MRIIFMGTPNFAAVSFKKLIENKYEIKLVVTQPDKPVGRKQILTPPPVKEVANLHNIDVIQPEKLRNNEEVFEKIKNLNPDVIVVVAYGKILPQEILAIPKKGCVNVHGSILPRYRGAAPIQWSVINGEETTGITTMFMNEGMDTGDILLQKAVKIDKNETSGELMEKLAEIGADLLVKTLEKLDKNAIYNIKQNNEEATFAPILKKADFMIDWGKNAHEIHNLIRGANPWPIAFTHLDGKIFKIYKSKIVDQLVVGPGNIINNRGNLTVACGENTSLELLQVQLEGKNKITGKEFIRGYKTPTKFQSL